MFVEAILYRYRAGIPWRDLPDRQISDRAVWVNISKLQQNWGKPNGFDAKQFKVFLNNLGSLGVGKFHPEDPDFWTMDEDAGHF